MQSCLPSVDGVAVGIAADCGIAIDLRSYFAAVLRATVDTGDPYDSP